MIEYANDSVISALRQYDMLAKSLKLTEDLEQKQDVSYQMTRIIEKVLEVTNKIYIDKFIKIDSKETYLMDEEKTRLLGLVNLINERKAYINNQVSSNRELTGLVPDSPSVLGEDKLDEYKEEIRVIDKYKKNVKLNSTLKDELTKLNMSIKKAKEKISTNKIMNKQLEEKMIRLIDRAIDKLSLDELKEREEAIDIAYTELGYSLGMAKENAKIARRDCSPEIKSECDNMLSSITLDYERYKEKKLILNLMEFYKDDVHDYESLLAKREKINSILSGIVSSDLYLEIGEELNREYADIKLEQQDAATLSSLEEEKEKKLQMLSDIKKENDSDKFKGILAHLLENEKKHQQILLEKKKQEDEKRRLKELEQEKIRRKEMLRRQKALEEERKKEIEERTKQLLEQKKNPILFTSKNDKIKDNDINTRSSVQSTLNKDDSVGRRNVYHRERNIFDDRESSYRNHDSNSKIIRASVKPKDDIFSRELTTRKIDDSIPVVRNNNLKNDFISTRNTDLGNADIFPKAKLKKESNIFPSFPDIDKDDSFFDEDEFQDLNKFVEEDEKKSWF